MHATEATHLNANITASCVAFKNGPTYEHPDPISAVKSAENVSTQPNKPVVSKKRQGCVKYVN